MKRFHEWMLCVNAAACIAVLVCANAWGSVQLFTAGMCFAGAAVVSYVCSRVL